tara:strand:+ start:275 stop:583 length:309 start_codon:yes stop_codon:yes gene_type:complete
MFSKGDVVVLAFPFSDLMRAKKRPVLVLGSKGEDIVGCAITSNPDVKGVPLREFKQGGLPLKSKAKYWQLQTFLKSLVVKKMGTLSKNNYKEVADKITHFIS